MTPTERKVTSVHGDTDDTVSVKRMDYVVST